MLADLLIEASPKYSSCFGELSLDYASQRIFSLRSSETDALAGRKKLLARKRLQCVMTVRDGKIAFDERGLAFPVWSEAGDYEVIP